MSMLSQKPMFRRSSPSPSSGSALTTEMEIFEIWFLNQHWHGWSPDILAHWFAVIDSHLQQNLFAAGSCPVTDFFNCGYRRFGLVMLLAWADRTHYFLIILKIILLQYHVADPKIFKRMPWITIGKLCVLWTEGNIPRSQKTSWIKVIQEDDSNTHS
jgi:hypothetical protein